MTSRWSVRCTASMPWRCSAPPSTPVVGYGLRPRLPFSSLRRVPRRQCDDSPFPSPTIGTLRALRIVLPIVATVAIVAPLAWLWQASRVPASVLGDGHGLPRLRRSEPRLIRAAGTADTCRATCTATIARQSRLITDLVADPARPADVRVELVTRQQSAGNWWPVNLRIHGQRHVARA